MTFLYGSCSSLLTYTFVKQSKIYTSQAPKCIHKRSNMWIYMHTHRDRQADTQTDRQASNHLKLTWMMWPMLEKEDGISMLEGKIF